jgi:hypothetical protein
MNIGCQRASWKGWARGAKDDRISHPAAKWQPFSGIASMLTRVMGRWQSAMEIMLQYDSLTTPSPAVHDPTGTQGDW